LEGARNPRRTSSRPLSARKTVRSEKSAIEVERPCREKLVCYPERLGLHSSPAYKNGSAEEVLGTRTLKGKEDGPHLSNSGPSHRCGTRIGARHAPVGLSAIQKRNEADCEARFHGTKSPGLDRAGVSRRTLATTPKASNGPVPVDLGHQFRPVWKLRHYIRQYFGTSPIGSNRCDSIGCGFRRIHRSGRRTPVTDGA